MKAFAKRIISLCLAASLLIYVPQKTAFAKITEEDFEKTISEQVEAFAKSIDIKNADGKAQDTLISHGISGKGKKLTVGKSHALTAMLVNSELGKMHLKQACINMVKTAMKDNEGYLCGLGETRWFYNGKYQYILRVYNRNLLDYSLPKRWGIEPGGYPDESIFYLDSYYNVPSPSFYNSYDSTARVLAGLNCFDVVIEKNLHPLIKLFIM